jgi:hypothetical protein
MFGKLSIALMVAASPAFAKEATPVEAARSDAPTQEFRIKKVCRTVEVAGSFIPRTSCVNKKIPVKKPEPEGQEKLTGQAGAADASAVEQGEQ